MSIPRIQLWKIARAFARRGGRFLYDEKGVPQDRQGMETNLTGLYIPYTLYHATEKYESMTLYELRDDGVLSEAEFEFLKHVSDIQTLEDEEWAQAIEEKINDELKAGNE